MRPTLVALASLLLLTTPALAKSRKKRAHVVSAAPTTQPAAPEAEAAPTGKLAMGTSGPAAMETRPTNRYITDGGNPAPGNVLVTPMVGHFALTGTEYGAKASVRVLEHGFVPALNNSVSVEGEVFRSTWRSWWGESESMHYGVVGRWDFHLHPKWTAYGAAGLIHEERETIADYEVNDSETDITIQVGGMLILAKNFRLRAEYDQTRTSMRFGAVLAL